MFLQHFLIIAEHHLRLRIAIALGLISAHLPIVFITIIPHYGNTILDRDILCLLKVYPHSHLRTIEWGLLYETGGATVIRRHKGCLIDDVTEEIAFEDLFEGRLKGKNLFFCILQTLNLLTKQFSTRLYM
jgi:hypothetical protein